MKTRFHYLSLATALYLLLLAASCSSSTLRYQNGDTRVRVDSATGSSWNESEIALDIQPEGHNLRVRVLGTATVPAEAVLLQLHFDPDYAVTDQLRLCEGGAVSLMTAAQPGVLGFGVIMPEGQRLDPGPLASFLLVPAKARAVSAAPTGDHGRVTDLSAELNGGGIDLSWGYWNAGDYDQNSEANISDLTPLAGRLYKSTSDGDLDAYDGVLDGDSNGEVNPSDITPLGVNFLHRASAYRVYRADGPDPDTANTVLIGEAAFDTSTLAPQSRRQFSFNIAAADTAPGAYYFIRAYDSADDSEGAASNTVQLAVSAPLWSSTVGIISATAGDGQVIVTWGEATDSDAPPVHYVVCYNPGASIDFGIAQTLVVDAPAQSTNVTGLTNDTEYSFAVRARDSAVPFNEDANTEQRSATPQKDLLFNSVPAGMTEVDPAFGLNPCLLLMPAVPDVSQDGAPIVAYTKTDLGGSFQTLTLAYFRGSTWQNTAIQEGRNFTNPILLWNTDEFILIAFEPSTGDLLDIRLNPEFQILSENTIRNSGGPVLGFIDVDVDPQSGNLGVASAYTSEVYFSSFDGNSWSTDPVIYSGDNIGGLTFRYDPAGGDPWMLYTHGTIDTSQGLLLNFDLDEARKTAGTWSASAVNTIGDSPLRLDLGFKADNSPQLAVTVGADFTAPIPGNPFTATMKFHVFTGSNIAGTWAFLKQFDSTFSVGITGGFPPTMLDLTLDFAPEAAWARVNELSYTRMQGSVTVDINTFVPNDGSLAGQMAYLKDSGAGFAPLLGYYTGEPGLSFSWQERTGRHACAFIKTAEQIDVTDILTSGNFNSANAMVYWQAP